MGVLISKTTFLYLRSKSGVAHENAMLSIDSLVTVGRNKY
jgi:hypothetical protein